MLFRIEALLAFGQSGREEDIEALIGVAIRLEEMPRMLKPSGCQARLFLQLRSRKVLGRLVRLVFPTALRQLPIAARHRISVLLDKIDSIAFEGHDDSVVVLADDGIKTLEPSSRMNSSSRTSIQRFL